MRTDSMPARELPAVPPISDVRRAMLDRIKASGPSTVDEVAESLRMTVSGARQQLQLLESLGLVAHRKIRSGRGRPRHLYELTERGDELFPRRYLEFTLELLDHLEEEAAGLADDFFEKRRDRRIRAARPRLEGLSLRDKVAELAKILSEDGYLASCHEGADGTFHLVERNCAVHAVAQRDPRACRSELEFFRSVLPGAGVERSSHLMAGDRFCGYTIAPEARPG